MCYCPKGKGGHLRGFGVWKYPCAHPVRHVDVKNATNGVVWDNHSVVWSSSPSRLAWLLHTSPFAMRLRRLTRPASPVDILGLCPRFAAV